jgi:hypothetical protein
LDIRFGRERYLDIFDISRLEAEDLLTKDEERMAGLNPNADDAEEAATRMAAVVLNFI